MEEVRKAVRVCLGKTGQMVGRLIYFKDGGREYSQFAYDPGWLADPQRFQVSPELALIEGHQTQRAPAREDSCFPYALADTEPDAWGRLIIARAHVRQRRENPSLQALTAFDYLSAVDDLSRIGALRLQTDTGEFLRTSEQGSPRTPPLLELEHIYESSRRVESNTETGEDLRYLQGKGTSLGGMRPKCTLLEADGALALGKFPSIQDARSVTRAEVLALRLAQRAGINAASARIVMVSATPIAVIRRFDRSRDHARIPYLSAASMLQSRRNQQRTYTEVADSIRASCARPAADVKELWRRLVFNLLITNVDDHLHNLAFLHEGAGIWRLAPAFDLNPFPDKDRESKTWLSEDAGPITSLNMLMQGADYFGLGPAQALQVLSEVYAAVRDWRSLALHADVGLRNAELEDFATAFEHPDMTAAAAMLA